MHLSDLISLLHDVVQLTANHFVSTCFPFSSCVLLNFCLITKFFWQLTCLFAIFCSMDFTLGSYWSCKKQSQKQFHDLDPQQTHIWSQLWLLPCTMRTHDTGLESGLKAQTCLDLTPNILNPGLSSRGKENEGENPPSHHHCDPSPYITGLRC